MKNIYVGNLSRGDLGHSWSENAPVSTLIASYVPWTLGLLGFATIVSFVGGTMLGVGLLHLVPHAYFELADIYPCVGWLLAGFLVAMLGAVIERVAVWPVLRGNANSHAWVITTLAVSLIITNVVGKIWGMDPVLVAAPWPLSTDPIQIGSVLTINMALETEV